MEKVELRVLSPGAIFLLFFSLKEFLWGKREFCPYLSSSYKCIDSLLKGFQRFFEQSKFMSNMCVLCAIGKRVLWKSPTKNIIKTAEKQKYNKVLLLEIQNPINRR